MRPIDPIGKNMWQATAVWTAMYNPCRVQQAGVAVLCIRTPAREISLSFQRCACRKSNPNILMMQSAEDWAAKNVASSLNTA